MARIRSIKPTFWSDEKISKLSKPCALFFIGLWNFCDDEGKFKNNPIQLSLQMPIFRSKDILKWLRELSQMNLILFSHDSQWGLVANWNHQKISKPILPKVKKEEIQWVTNHDSRNVPGALPEHSMQGKDRIGEDKIGKDFPTGLKHPPVSGGKTLGSLAFEAYAEAYLFRYGTAPVRNRRINSQFGLLGERLGTEAPEVARFYVNHFDSFYVKSGHSVGLLLRDAEKLRTEWATGKKITNLTAKQMELAGSNNDVFDEFLQQKKQENITDVG